MTEEKKPFNFTAPFTAPTPAPTPASTGTIEDIDSMAPGQTITITGIMHDDIYHNDLRRKYEKELAAGTLTITYHRTDERNNHDEWAKGGTITVIRR